MVKSSYKMCSGEQLEEFYIGECKHWSRQKSGFSYERYTTGLLCSSVIQLAGNSYIGLWSLGICILLIFSFNQCKFRQHQHWLWEKPNLKKPHQIPCSSSSMESDPHGGVVICWGREENHAREAELSPSANAGSRHIKFTM